MARPRSFDPVSVLDAAAAEFRVHGFADTSTERLCEAAGVRRSSLYNTFVSKEELFFQSLVRYIDVIWERQKEILTDSDLDGGVRLWRILELVVEEESSARAGGHAAGCMVVNTLMAPGVRGADSRVQSVLERDYERRCSLLTQTVRVGQADGSILPGISPEDVALSVITVISGLRVAAQAGESPESLLRIVRTCMGSVLG
ncbi:TetR/AcrR family transcriptional regulator [Corynebacterium lowii]|uniref:HTH-type transcriptional repressor ComR n=1 Tax=Corynebacterium lowii TaxID=1544413 RepID=A0A0Q0UC69_9CORY|nr:TetR/AcrR family transcriptional regulator [Corynebacterium lowii]KQB83963.1 HTH-type transcriptional repressor ComR [Corynebacterium lowii]MDP9852787.1 AcrR family transcriptional regulator [Corynebacterium lowii]